MNINISILDDGVGIKETLVMPKGTKCVMFSAIQKKKKELGSRNKE